MKKRILIFGLSILTVTCLVFAFFYKDIEFTRLKADRENLIYLIKHGEIMVQPNGCIILPDAISNISDSGECFLIRFDEETAIYFFSYRGFIDSSKGYVYITNELLWSDYIDTEYYVPDIDFSEIVWKEKNWYYCKTG